MQDTRSLFLKNLVFDIRLQCFCFKIVFISADTVVVLITLNKRRARLTFDSPQCTFNCYQNTRGVLFFVFKHSVARNLFFFFSAPEIWQLWYQACLNDHFYDLLVCVLNHFLCIPATRTSWWKASPTGFWRGFPSDQPSASFVAQGWVNSLCLHNYLVNALTLQLLRQSIKLVGIDFQY